MSVVSAKLGKLLTCPLNQVGQRAQRMDDKTLNEIAVEAEGLAQRAAFLGEYLAKRGGMGSGDSGHAEALKAANRICRNVRKAMGFTYPDSGLATVRF